MLEPGRICALAGGDGHGVILRGNAASGYSLAALAAAAPHPAEGMFALSPADITGPAEGRPFAGTCAADVWNTRRIAEDGLDATPWILTPAALDSLLRQGAKSFAGAHHAATRPWRPFAPGTSAVPVSGKSWGAEEVENLVDASLDFWLTAGRFNEQFERDFAARIQRRHALTVNSGSSANLLAVATLCSHKLGERRLKPGDEVITVAAAFPTTVAPLVQHGLVPVFVDASAPTFNVIVERLEEALSPRSRAIMLAHTLGNPFDLEAVLAFARAQGLWVIEDACDALGSTYTLPGEEPRPCGSFGDLATFSFYPAHHITMGEGGAVACNDATLYRIALSLRDWGRDCWCPPGHDDTCKKRYQWSFPLLPPGYDHKYVYSHLGYNLKITDMQAAVGMAQLERLDGFCQTRRRNYAQLRAALRPLEGDSLILPEATPRSDPAWFGFLMQLHPRHDRRALLEYLNSKKIGTRLLFAGNILRQPCFEQVHHRVCGSLEGTEAILNHAFWVGTCPELSEAHVAYMANCLLQWFSKAEAGA